MITWLSFAALVALVWLGWNLSRRFGSDRITAFTERRRSTSKMVGRGEFVDGNRHVDVALAVTDSTFYYENADMQASLDLDRVREIEYDTELGTGGVVEGGRVLRLRSDSQTFEFVVPNDIVSRWYAALPPHRSHHAAEGTDGALETLVPVAE